jgi:phosphatidylglycerophosphatase A
LTRARLAQIIATWFGCGYAPKAPGTAGSLAALVIAILLHRLSPWMFAALATALFAPAVWAAGVTARETGLKDPQIVVVDEVIGMWITIAGMQAYTWKAWLAAFLLFRLFDMWKPSPVRQLERLPGGLGIVADDVMAGIYAALVLFLAGWFNSINTLLYGIS